ncbi:MAG: RNA 3'-terminal phosphate cyclase [Deltaproteobacteria bacterium]|nr:RNA 3'-terminal phosphate cyclase [Deltaproteobacteria bacterium]
MITIDGSVGEGGGQVLRTSLALSAHTGQPFGIHSIRKSRSKPGLARQHLTCVRAATAICGARVSGAEMRSTELTFHPGAVLPGEYSFAIGTAGSCNLVLQTVLPPLMLASEPSLITLQGGTHNDHSPPFHFLQAVFLPLLGRMGPTVELDLVRWGFFPAGGGEFTASIEPVAALQRLDIVERGYLRTIRPTAVVSLLPKRIARRELEVISDKLRLGRKYGRMVDIKEPQGPGNVVMVEVESEHITELFTGFGAKRVRAETVAARVADQVQHYLDTNVPVGTHLADQLLIPMALAGGGRFRTVCPDAHTPTNASVIQQFLDVPIAVEEEGEGGWVVEVG